jgi:hypothetical protein
MSDGSSNTILLGERNSLPETGPDPRKNQGAIWIGRYQKNHSHVGGSNFSGDFSSLGRSGWRNYAVNGHYRGRGIASSGHPAGATVSLGDGSSHFISDNLDVRILQDLTSIADGDTIGKF